MGDRSKRSTGAVAGLPDDPLVEILSRVPAKSVCRFRCVSKAWRDLIDDPLNRRKLPQTLEGFFAGHDPMRSPFGCDAGSLDFINVLTRSVPLDIDPCFSFLTKLPEIQNLFYEDSCNGLFLFQHYRKCPTFAILGYIVCNPATKHWGTVPPCGCCPPSASYFGRKTFLAFDPAVSSHFHIIQFWKPPVENRFVAVLAYSSETGIWSHNQADSDEQRQLEAWRHHSSLTGARLQRAYDNGILHLIVLEAWEAHMVALDVQGKTKRMIAMLAVAEGRCWATIPYIGLSQGRLHYINHDFDACSNSYELSVWVLQDYDTQGWVLKDTATFLRLFGRTTVDRQDFDVVAIHPHCSVVFLRHSLNRLIAYDMDRKEVSVVAAWLDFNKSRCMSIAPYIPYFSESAV